jgi:preprotein translocase subunit SecB
MTRKNPKNKAGQNLAGYTDFIKSLNLSVIALSESSAKVDRGKYLNEENHAISIGWKSRPATSGDDYFDVLAELTVKVSKPKSQVHFLEIKASYLLHVHCMKDFPKEHVARFCDVEMRLMIWPYFREFVTGMCGRMHIPPVFLPLATRPV